MCFTLGLCGGNLKESSFVISQRHNSGNKDGTQGTSSVSSGATGNLVDSLGLAAGVSTTVISAQSNRSSSAISIHTPLVNHL